MIFAVVVVFIFCYIASLQDTIDTRTVSVEHWFLPVAFGFGLLIIDEARKYCVRMWPNGILAKIAW
jgi:sodium/potassium-transporting ATPase subunit alpha